MALDSWIAFTLAAAVMLAIPGPTVLLVVSYALSCGRRVAAATVTGVVLGDMAAMTASLLGLGTLLATSAALFTVVKWVGAAYLIYLGIKLWRAPVAHGETTPVPARQVHAARILGHAFLVTALNPKSLVFFLAFLPPFLDPSRPLLPQMIVLEGTFLVLAGANASAYAAMASGSRGLIRSARVHRAINRTGGGLLVGAGLIAAGWKRAG